MTWLTYSIDTLLLGGGVEDYEYLNKSRREVDGVNDREEWFALKVGQSFRLSSSNLTRVLRALWKLWASPL